MPPKPTVRIAEAAPVAVVAALAAVAAAQEAVAADVAQEAVAADVAQEAVAAEVAKVAPEAAQVAPEAAQVAPEAAQVAPEAAVVAPEAAQAAPEEKEGIQFAIDIGNSTMVSFVKRGAAEPQAVTVDARGSDPVTTSSVSLYARPDGTLWTEVGRDNISQFPGDKCFATFSHVKHTGTAGACHEVCGSIRSLLLEDFGVHLRDHFGKVQMGVDLGVKLKEFPDLRRRIKETAEGAEADAEAAAAEAEADATAAADAADAGAVRTGIQVEGDMVWLDADALLVRVIRRIFHDARKNHDLGGEVCRPLTVFVHLPGGLPISAAVRLHDLVRGVLVEERLPHAEERLPGAEVRVLLESLSAALSFIETLKRGPKGVPTKMLVVDMGGGTVSVSLNHVEYSGVVKEVGSFALEASDTTSALAGWNQTAVFRRAAAALVEECYGAYAPLNLPASRLPEMTMDQAEIAKICLGREGGGGSDVTQSLENLGLRGYHTAFCGWHKGHHDHRPSPTEVKARFVRFFSPEALAAMMAEYHGALRSFLWRFVTKVDADTSVILVGGASLGVGVQALVSSVFPSQGADKVCRSVFVRSKEHAVALGAFIPSRVGSLNISCVTTTQLGILYHDSAEGGHEGSVWRVQQIVDRGQALPVSSNETCFVTYAMQEWRQAEAEAAADVVVVRCSDANRTRGGGRATAASTATDRMARARARAKVRAIARGIDTDTGSLMDITFIEGTFDPEAVFTTRHPVSTDPSAPFSIYDATVYSSLPPKDGLPLTISVNRDADQALHLSVQIEGDKECSLFLHLHKQGAGQQQQQPQRQKWQRRQQQQQQQQQQQLPQLPQLPQQPLPMQQQQDVKPLIQQLRQKKPRHVIVKKEN